jgi:hypothetical protein
MTRSNVLSAHPGRVRERLIAALVPNAVERPESVPAAPVPLLPALARVQHAGPAALLVATARIDGSGRVCERLVLRALGWQPGQRLAMDALHGLIVVAAVPDGPCVVDGRGAVGLPAPLRRLCGIKPGPPVVLAAVVAAQVLIVHPPTMLTELVARHYTSLLGGRHGC